MTLSFIRKLLYLLICVVTFCSHSKELIVGINTNSYPPYYIHDNGELNGFSLDVAELIAAKLGHTLKYQALPWARINQYLQEGKIDMVLLYLETEQRKEYVHYASTPYIKESYRFFKKNRSQLNYTGYLQDISNTSIGVIRGYSYGSTFDNFNFAKKYISGSEVQLLEMLQKDRVELIVGNEAVIKYHARAMQLDNKITALNPQLTEKPAFFAFSKRRPESEKTAREFSTMLDKTLDTAAYNYLLIKHHLALAPATLKPLHQPSE